MNNTIILMTSIGIIILYIIFLYNNIIVSKNNTEQAFGSIDTILKKRYDLLPNLVEIVKQYMQHETMVLLEVTRLRAQMDNKLTDKQIELHNEINKRLSGFLMTVENYPNIKANQNFLNLQATWTEIEEQISAAKRFFNSAVTAYNNSIETFPSNIIARIFHFYEIRVLETDDKEKICLNAKDIF